MTNNEPLISVVMNCYNSSLYLREALESVIAQTYKNLEIVFWDNQSKDESAAIFKGYNDSRLKYYYASEHTKLSTARNLAVEKAEGEYLAFLDCDDIWYPEKLEKQIRFFTDNSNVGIVYSLFEPFIDSDSKNAKQLYNFYSKFKLEPHEPKNIFDSLLIRNTIIFSTVLLKKDLFWRCGGFSPGLSQNEDYEILLKFSNISLAACDEQILTKYRVHASNNSFQNGELNFLESRIIYKQFLPSKNVKLAIDRNEIRYSLFKLFYLKKISGLNVFFKKNAIPLLYEIFLNRLNK